MPSDQSPPAARAQPDAVPMFRGVATVAGAVVAAVAGAYLAAWLAGVMAPRGEAAITMKTNAALCLLLLGLSLLCLADANAGAIRRWSGRILAVVALVIGTLTFVENVLGWDLGIDQLLASEPPGARGVIAPNRMGSPGSSSVALGGLALVLLSLRSRRALGWAHGLAVAVCVIGLLPTVGYLYGVRWLYGLARVTAIAWPTALALIVLGVGLLFARSTEGLLSQLTAADAGGAILRRLLLPLLLLPIGLGWLEVQFERLGLVEPAMGTALLVLTFMLSLSAVAWLAGRRGSQADAEQRQAAEALRRYELVVQESRDVLLFVRREDGRILAANPAAAETYGYSRDELLSMSVFDLRAPDTRRTVEADMVNADAKGVLFETVHVRKDGSTFPAEVSSRGAHIGPVRVLISVVRDITSRKRAELALRRANERLRENDERKNEFLAVLSHELRNPLAPIQNGLRVLERVPPGSEPARRAQDVIERQVRQLSRLVEDLLDVVRVSRNKIRLRLAALELNDLVRRTLHDHRSLFDECGIRVTTELSDQPLPLNGDEARLSQVVGNLLQNAAKFTPAGGQVTIRTTVRPPGARAALHVADTGMGIDPQTLPRLFEPFMQADTTLDRSKGGLGLGLALVKGLVEMHGGSVSAHSEGAERGAEFTVELPLARDTRPVLADHAPGRSLPARRVLIIEDNLDAGDTLRTMLELDGHVVRVARDGAEGIAAAKEFRPDVVLCDIGLPGMDGFEVARAFRADAALKSVSLVALTGYALNEDVERAREAGFGKHLAKPATPEAIHRVLADVPPFEPSRDEPASLS